MKNVWKKIVSVALICVMMLSLVSCDKSEALKKAFEKEGYEVTVVDSTNPVINTIAKVMLNDEQVEKLADYEMILCKKTPNVAIIVKFPNSAELKSFLTVENKDGTKDTAIYDELNEEGFINGNCLCLTVSSDAQAIFEKA